MQRFLSSLAVMSTRQNFTRVISDSRESARMRIVLCNTAPGFTHNPPHRVHRNLQKIYESIHSLKAPVIFFSAMQCSDKSRHERDKDRSMCCRTDFRRDYETATSIAGTFIVSPIVLSFRYGIPGRPREDITLKGKDRGKPVQDLPALLCSRTGIFGVPPTS